jgi:hypothetical protein
MTNVIPEGDGLDEQEQEADASQSERTSASICPSCGGTPRWESLLEGEEERWLAICRCGRMHAYLPEQPAFDPEDPLRAFLLGPARPIFPAAPPWIRLFLASIEGPNPVRWRYAHWACPRCGASASFGLQACPRPNTFAISALCIACGHVTTQYSEAARGLVEAPVDGNAWAPPCPAVQRLRDCLHRPHSQLCVDGWHIRAWDDLRRGGS